MMNCGKAQSLMMDHLYGELGPRKEKAFMRHLSECSKCSEEFETSKATASTFAKLSMEEPPAGLSAKVAAMAADDIERLKAGRTVLSYWNWKPAVATLAVATLVVVFGVNYTPRSRMERGTMQAPAPPPTMAAKRPAPESHDERKQLASSLEERAEGEVSTEFYALGDKAAAVGRYGGRPGIAGDDVVVNGLLKSAPAKMRERGLVGGKISMDQPRDSIDRLLAEAPVIEQEPELLMRKDAQLSIGYDFKDSSEVSHAGAETQSAPAPHIRLNAQIEGPDAVMPMSAPAEPLGADTFAAGASASRLSASETTALEMPTSKKEKARDVGGVGYAGARESDLDAVQEEAAGQSAYFNRREFNEAVMDYEKSINAKPDGRLAPQAKYRLGRTYQEQDQCEKAIAVYEAIPDEHPDFGEMADVYIALGECYLKLDRFDDASRSFEFVRDKFPENKELASKRLGEIVELKKASQKASEPAAESGE